MTNRIAQVLKAIETRNRTRKGSAIRKFVLNSSSKDRLDYSSIIKFQGIDEERMCATFVASTAKQDRDGDILMPQGCITANFARNPLIFFSHQEWLVPIGKAVDPETGEFTVKILPDKVLVTVFFDRDDPDAVKIFKKVVGGYLNAVSVGFIPLDAERIIESDKANSQGAAIAGWLVKTWELLEISVVGVPANPDAVLIGKGLSLKRALKRTERINMPIKKNGKLISHGPPNPRPRPKARPKSIKADVLASDAPPDPNPGSDKSSALDIQEVRLSKERFGTQDDAAAWLEDQGLESGAITETETDWVSSQFPVDELVDGSAHEEPIENGITGVVGQRQTEVPDGTQVNPETGKSARKSGLTPTIPGTPGNDLVETAEEPDDDEEVNEKPGAQFVRAMYDALDEHGPRQENPDTIDAHTDIRAMIDDLAQTHYPDEHRPETGTEQSQPVKDESVGGLSSSGTGAGPRTGPMTLSARNRRPKGYRINRKTMMACSEAADFLEQHAEHPALEDDTTSKAACKYHSRALKDIVDGAGTASMPGDDTQAQEQQEEDGKSLVAQLRKELDGVGKESARFDTTLKSITGRS